MNQTRDSYGLYGDCGKRIHPHTHLFKSPERLSPLKSWVDLPLLVHALQCTSAPGHRLRTLSSPIVEISVNFGGRPQGNPVTRRSVNKWMTTAEVLKRPVWFREQGRER